MAVKEQLKGLGNWGTFTGITPFAEGLSMRPVRKVLPSLRGRRTLTKPASIVGWRRLLALNTDEFCRNTSLHGLKYIKSRRLHAADRLFFGLAFLGVLSCAGFLMQDAFVKWNTTPVIVGINPEPTYINKEPFPALTVCNLNQALASKAAQLLNDSAQFDMLQLLCRRRTRTQLTRGQNNWEQLISNISQPCGDMVIDCRFGGTDHQCGAMFQPIVTDEGLCCVFNMLHPRFMYKHNIPMTLRNVSVAKGYTAVNWHAEQGYGGNMREPPDDWYPRASQGTGESLGLSLLLNVEADAYYCSSGNSIGFKIALHSPNESPNVRETGVLLSPGLETKVRIEPSKVMTALNLRSVHRRARHCLFRDEGNLSYFAHYTQRNCEMECVSRLLLQRCGCVVFYMPRINGNDTVCSIREAQCVERVRVHMKGLVIETCLDSCLPSCFDLTYNVNSFSTKISYNDFRIANAQVSNFSRDYVERNIAVVHFYYKEHTFRAKKQTEFIGISDFLSNVGGLMGLFLGFSFLSIAECVYFGLIRPCRICVQLWKRSPVSSLELEWDRLASSRLRPAVVPIKRAAMHVSTMSPREQWQRERRRPQPWQPANWFRAELGQQYSMA